MLVKCAEYLLVGFEAAELVDSSPISNNGTSGAAFEAAKIGATV